MQPSPGYRCSPFAWTRKSSTTPPAKDKNEVGPSDRITVKAGLTGTNHRQTYFPTFQVLPLKGLKGKLASSTEG